MTVKIAINGYGRIGRLVLRAIYENNRRNEIQVVAINDPGMKIETAAHLTKYDSMHHRFNADVKIDGDALVVNGDRIAFLAEKNPAALPWGKMGVDVVHECSGVFTKREKAKAHLDGGAKKVLISAPGEEMDLTVVYGVNHQDLKASYQFVSNASCTTNCLAPMVKPLIETVGIERGLMTTIHAYTNDQVLADGPHKDLRRARAAALSMIPTKTGAAAAVGLVLPQMKGLLDGFAIRVPTANVSIVDLSFKAKKETSVEEINSILKKAAEGELKGILAYNTEPLVSIDFNHTSVSSTFDSTLTRVIGDFVKVCAWYDNEWGFSNRMLDTTLAWMVAK